MVCLIKRSSTSVQEEALLVVAGLGVQMRTRYASGKQDFQFVDQARLHGVVLNECVTLNRVVCYLALVVKDQPDLVVAFQHLNPKLDVLVQIYRDTWNVMFGDKLAEPIDTG
eukprot:CAMPEP_0113948156 /NCGR_PEP_ID=MMETSP1339-20121228/68797_1 /TAXON_ID=94617 /ORGANISM="Fibrocapsa japonica" /LENGTH=111 /DNA_ID=CAMNT_0000955087 /DNA_START=151 /DNA_END=486 /DNA_ORIENTATION=+ /assembly_acc=CAM_ASM_000762